MKNPGRVDYASRTLHPIPVDVLPVGRPVVKPTIPSKNLAAIRPQAGVRPIRMSHTLSDWTIREEKPYRLTSLPELRRRGGCYGGPHVN